MSQLKHLREIQGKTLEEIATLVKCDKSAVCFWEAHFREPKRPYRKRYAKALKISVGQLGKIVYEDQAGE